MYNKIFKVLKKTLEDWMSSQAHYSIGLMANLYSVQNYYTTAEGKCPHTEAG